MIGKSRKAQDQQRVPAKIFQFQRGRKPHLLKLDLGEQRR
jgi:hypothetical protein